MDRSGVQKLSDDARQVRRGDISPGPLLYGLKKVDVVYGSPEPAQGYYQLTRADDFQGVFCECSLPFRTRITVY